MPRISRVSPIVLNLFIAAALASSCTIAVASVAGIAFVFLALGALLGSIGAGG